MTSASAKVFGKKVFKRLYLLNLWMVHTCLNVKYWSEVLCCFIPNHMSGLEVSVTDLGKRLLLKFLVKVFRGRARFGRATIS